MFFRKLIPLLLIFVAGAFWGKPFALGTVGLFAKTYLFFGKGWLFDYGSIEWQNGRFIFSEVDLAERAGSLHAERIEILMREQHLEVWHPKVMVKNIPQWSHEGNWTVSIKDGILEGIENFGPIHFSFEKIWPYHLGRLVLEQDGARLDLEAIGHENEIRINAGFVHFRADQLKQWIDLKGFVDGRIHLIVEGTEWKEGSIHLDFSEGGYKEAISGATGALDWEGSFDATGVLCLDQISQMRLKLSQGCIEAAQGGISNVRGMFSFTKGIGAKWEFEGTGMSKQQEFPVSWSGKAFLHRCRPQWLESRLVCLDALANVLGQEEEEGYRWKGTCHGVGAIEATLIQSLCALFNEHLPIFEIEHGWMDAEGGISIVNDQIKEWDLSLKARELCCQNEKYSVRCDFGEANISSNQNGSFALSNTSFRCSLAEDQTIVGDMWKGTGDIEHGTILARLDGKIKGFELQAKIIGSLKEFQLAAEGSDCKIAVKGEWRNDQLSLILEEGYIAGLSCSGTGWIDIEGGFECHLDRFHGPLLPLGHALGAKYEIAGEIWSDGIGFKAAGHVASFDWFLQARGELAPGIGFYCPAIEKKGDDFVFDLRIETPVWELARFYGTAGNGMCMFDPERTQILGKQLHVSQCLFDSSGILSLNFGTEISWKTFIAAAPLWFPEAGRWIGTPLEGEALFHFSYARELGSKLSLEGTTLVWEGDKLLLHLVAEAERNIWHISTLQMNQWNLSGAIKKEKSTLQILEGRAETHGIEALFEGSIGSPVLFDLYFSRLSLDLEQVHPLASFLGIPIKGLEGNLEGAGFLKKQGNIEADFDFVTSDLKAASLQWQNQGSIHLHYGSDLGIVCTGLDLCAKNANQPIFFCKTDLLQFDAFRSLWTLNHANILLPAHFFDLFSNRPSFLQSLDSNCEISFSANFECPSDFSSFSCFVKHISLPINQEMRQIQDFSLIYDETQAKAKMQLFHQGQRIWIGAYLFFGPNLSGRLIFDDKESSSEEAGRPLAIDWIYSRGIFRVLEIDGQCFGIDASFHALDEGPLIGSARIHFSKISELIPKRIASVFQDLKIGKGYEIKGKLSYDQGHLSFQGLLSGKQIELFGFQFRTLLGQIELDSEKVHIYDLKISDSAGMLKMDELLASGHNESPWTLSIPHLTIFELRPSLLQKEGQDFVTATSHAGPLVIRELKIAHLKGLLEETSTYTATGELTFINSYRREHTVFDIPADLLGRIVGLDLDLLIPACGKLTYELKDRVFYLTSLQDAFSEGQRSEFFLATDPSPSMDFDGNLLILITMKQFVLFKFTESFQILIDGKLDDPQFHLQKKRRFFGL